MTLLPIIELCKCSPGMVTAMGVSVGLTATRDHVEGHDRAEGAVGPRPAHARQDRRVGDHRTELRERRVRLDAGDRAARRRRVRAQGSKTFITNGPYADTIVFICKLDEGNAPADRKVVQFVLDKGMPGLEQSKPLRKMGLHSSPTGMLFLDDVRVGRDRLLGESEEAFGGSAGREASKATFVDGAFGRRRDGARHDRTLHGAVHPVREGTRAVRQADRRVPAHPAQAGEDGSRAAQRREPRVPLPRVVAGRQADDALGSVGDEAVLARSRPPRSRSKRCSSSAATATWPSTRSSSSRCDAKVLQIYAGTDEIQVGQIARSLLA